MIFAIKLYEFDNKKNFFFNFLIFFRQEQLENLQWLLLEIDVVDMRNIIYLKFDI